MFRLFRSTTAAQPEPAVQAKQSSLQSLDALAELIEEVAPFDSPTSPATATATATPSKDVEALDLSVRLFAETHAQEATQQQSPRQVARLMRGLRKSISLLSLGSSKTVDVDGIQVDASAKEELDKMFEGLEIDIAL